MMNEKLTYLTPPQGNFEDIYIKVREKEGWLCTDEELRKFPDVSYTERNYEIWRIRERSALEFIRFVKGAGKKKVLEVGCGHGWFSNFTAQRLDVDVLGIDINEEELLQANRVFSAPNLRFAYADVFQAKFEQKFDVIVLNGCIQYFPDPAVLIERLRSLLSPEGQMHIIDSPIYESVGEARKARERTRIYFEELGFPEMLDHYFHHTMGQFSEFTVRKERYAFFKRIYGNPISPFPWMILQA